MAEWLGSGLQNHLHRFESGSDLTKTQLLTTRAQPRQKADTQESQKSYQQKINNSLLK